MTLIVGLKCSQGIVLGADGAATLGQPGQPTATQPYVKKLSICHDNIVIGVSGPVGIGQRLRGIVSDLFTEKKFSGKKTHQVMQVLREEFWNRCLSAEYQVADVARRIQPAAAMNALCSSVVAMPVDHNWTLIQFDSSASPEAATKDLPFVAIGSGQAIADPFLAFIRRIFWEGREPNLAEGQFAVWWTLHHAIKSATGGVSDPKQIVVLERNQKGSMFARELADADMQEHGEAVAAAEAYMQKFDLMRKAGPPTAAVPKMPEPPSDNG